MKKFILTSIVVAIFGLANIYASSDDMLSFAVISDVHHGKTVGENSRVKVPKALKSITSYKELDAIFTVGDLTDNGKSTEYDELLSIWNNAENFTNSVGQKVFMMGNHDNRDANAQTNYSNALKGYNQGEAYPLDQYLVIKGYPFITISQRNSANNDISNVANGTEAYPEEVCEKLDQWLAQAASDCPGKPIFVFTHVAPRNTCYSSWPTIEGTPWSMNVLNPILNKYPQAVVFAGHSHYPIGDPRSIHQGANPQSARQNYYTVINTASSTYSEIHNGAVAEGIHPAGYAIVTEGMILTEQPNGDIEIRRYDTYRNEEIDPEHRWVLKAPFDGSMFEYADKRDANDNPNGAILRDGLPAPVFASTAMPEVKTNNTQATVTFPQATDETCVFRYKVSALKDGVAVNEKYVFSQFYLNSAMPETISATLENLDSGTEYTFMVTAYDSYDNASEPISTDASTTETTVAPVGVWTFDNTDDILAGNSELTLQAVQVASGIVTAFDDPSTIGIVPTDGPNIINKAIIVPKGSYLKLNHMSSSVVNSYTLMYDIKPKVLSGNQSLLQTNLKNDNEGDFFIKNKTIGLNRSNLGYGGTLVEGKWHRVVFVVNEGFATTYLDGVKIGASTNADNVWPLDPSYALLFADNNGEEGVIDLAELAYWNQALSEKQVLSLGEVNIRNYVEDPSRITPSDLKDGDLIVFEAASTPSHYSHYVKDTGGAYKWLSDFDDYAVWQVIETGNTISKNGKKGKAYRLRNAATGRYIQKGSRTAQTLTFETTEATELAFFDNDKNKAPYNYADDSNYPRGWDDHSWVVYDKEDFWWRNYFTDLATGTMTYRTGTTGYMWNVRRAYLLSDVIGELQEIVAQYHGKDFNMYVENVDLSDFITSFRQAESYLADGTADNSNYLRVLTILKAASQKLVLRSYGIGEQLNSTQIVPGDLIVIEAASTTKLYGHYLTEQAEKSISNRNCLTLRSGYEQRDIWEVVDGGNGNIILRNYLTRLYVSRDIGQLTTDIGRAYQFTLMSPQEAGATDYTDKIKYPRGWDQNSVVFKGVDNRNYWLSNDGSKNATDNELIYFNGGMHRICWNVYRAAEMLNAYKVGNLMTLHGQLTPETFQSFIDNTDVADAQSVDLTAVDYIVGISLAEMQSMFNDNVLFLTPASAGLSGNNLIVNGKCENLVITDGKPFAAPADFTATTASYKRTMPNGSTWGTICLPYEVSSNENVTYYASGTIEGSTLTLVEAETVPAGTPAIFQTNATTLSAIGTGDVDVKANLKNATSDITLIGTYASIKVTDENAYYIKSNKFWRRAEGADGYFTVAPFRAYFTAVNSASPSFNILVNDDDVTSINDFIEKSAEIVCYYDLVGNKYNVPRKGVNIIEYTTGEKQTIIIK